MVCERNLLNYSTLCGHEKHHHYYYCLPGAEGEWLCLARGKALIHRSEGCLHVPAVGVALAGLACGRGDGHGIHLCPQHLEQGLQNRE